MHQPHHAHFFAPKSPEKPRYQTGFYFIYQSLTASTKQVALDLQYSHRNDEPSPSNHVNLYLKLSKESP
jgi:hypothetical protein